MTTDTLAKLAAEFKSILATYGITADMAADELANRALTAQALPAAPEPIAEIGSVCTLIWAGCEPVADIMRRNGLKVGDKLYAKPQAAQQAAQAPAVTCGNGCACAVQCGDTYAHHGEPKPPKKAAEWWELAPKVATTAMLRPFYNCPPDELQLAWETLLLVATLPQPPQPQEDAA